MTVGFWILIGGLGFALALAVQMRMMIALVLRRALFAGQPGLSPASANALVVQAADLDETSSAEARDLAATYPAALSHLRTARRACTVIAVMIVAALLAGRYILKVF